MRRKISEMKGGDVTKYDYRLLGLVAVALAFAFILNACLGVTVTRRAGAAAPGDEAVTLINAYRAGLGLAPLRTDARLVGAADFHNRWMRDNDCFAHQCPNEPGPGDRATAAGYPSAAVGEVIGRGYQDAAAVVTGGAPAGLFTAKHGVWPTLGAVLVLLLLALIALRVLYGLGAWLVEPLGMLRGKR